MVSQLAKTILAFLRDNVSEGIEEIEDAREFVLGLEGLAHEERMFLELALVDQEVLEVICKAFPPSPTSEEHKRPRSLGKTRDTPHVALRQTQGAVSP